MNEIEIPLRATTIDITKKVLDREGWGAVSENIEYEERADFDEISFRPITTGLGFTKPVQRVAELQKRVALRTNTKEFRYIDRPLKDKKEMLSSMALRALEPTSNENFSKTSHLAAFYEQEREEVVRPKKNKLKKYFKATAESRFTAWVLDSTLITIILFGFTALITTLFELNFADVLLSEGRGFVLPFWSLLYIIYFTILDLDRSFGKSLMKIKVIRGQESISIIDTFIRSITSLITVFCFGLPLLFNLPGQLSDTKVVKWK